MRRVPGLVSRVPGLVSRVPGLVSRVPGLVSRVPGLLEPCLPSLCFFLWSIRVSGLHQGSGILGLLFPFIVFLLVRDLFPGFRDFWNFVSHHCFCFVVHQGAGLHQGSGILGPLSPIIVFFLVVYQGSGIFGTLSPIIVFVLWSIRVPGFLDFCFPSLCFFWFRDLSPEYQDLSPGFRDLSPGFRDFWNLVSHHCVFSCGLSGLRDFWKFVSHHCVCSVVHQGAGLHQGSGILRLLFPIIVFLLVPGLVSRVPGLVSRVPGLVEPCLPSLCFFLWFMRAPGFLEIPNSRACWVSISRAGAGSRGLAAFKIRNGTLEPWNPGTLDPWNPNPRTVEL